MCIISLATLGAALAATLGSTLAASAIGTTAGVAAGAATSAAFATATSALGGTLGFVAAEVAVTGALVGGAVSTVGGVQQAEQQRQQADFLARQEEENARLARREAEAIKVMGDQERSKLRLQMLDQQAAGRTGYAAGGVVLGSGTTLDYEADIADAYDLDVRNLEYDIASRRWKKQVEATNASDQARMYRMQAKSASSNKTMSLLGGITNTVSSVASAGMSAYGSLNKIKGIGSLFSGSPTDSVGEGDLLINSLGKKMFA